jgi:predicted alpha/beta superfamily hydrolase
MKALRYIIQLLLFCTAASAQFPKVHSGTIRRFENFPSRYIDPRNVDVWLPAGYTPSKKYAVLYMHDGQMLFDSSITWNRQEWHVDEVAGALMDNKRIHDVIIVGVWNNYSYRHSEYFPEKPLARLPAPLRDTIIKRELKGKSRADEYLQFMVNELKPFIDSTFGTYTDRKHTFIAGSSMGGLISMYAICEYPKVFGGAACLSTHWPGSLLDYNREVPLVFQHYLQDNLPAPRQHKIYFDYGTATLDSLYEPYQLQVDAIMKSKKYRAKNWKTLKFEGEPHAEQAWARRLHIPLLFLLAR